MLLELSAMCAQPAHSPAVLIKPDMISEKPSMMVVLLLLELSAIIIIIYCCCKCSYCCCCCRASRSRRGRVDDALLLLLHTRDVRACCRQAARLTHKCVSCVLWQTLSEMRLAWQPTPRPRRNLTRLTCNWSCPRLDQLLTTQNANLSTKPKACASNCNFVWHRTCSNR